MPINFWEKLQQRRQPILALAPLAGFTDSAFRQVCKKYGADVLYSEMASAAALFYTLGRIDNNGAKGQGAANKIFKNSTIKLLKFDRAKEKYYVVQLFGAEPQHFAAAAKIITEKIKPDGIDINFGCPVPKVVKQGAGCGLMKDLKRARAAIEAVLANTDLPISIKIRAKSGEINALEFLKNISDLPVSAIMIHGRTHAQGFAGEPDWKIIKDARKYFKGVVLANGGINDLNGAKRVLKASGADGLGLARGILGRPWLFKEIKKDRIIDLKPKAIFKIALDHATLVSKLKGKIGLIELRKHLVWYVVGLPGAAKIRERLVKVVNLKDIKDAWSKAG
ncbi:MAG: tRNA-dihydrouridine synthase family protein [Patescibacteria group bacterium]|jgi:tRNA-dihydrouridine synthase B